MPLANSGGQDFGPITLTDALTNSVNTVFAEVGEKLGRETLIDYMDRFGFNQDPQLDYPDDQMTASGVAGLQAAGCWAATTASTSAAWRSGRAARRARSSSRRSRWRRWPAPWATTAC